MLNIVFLNPVHFSAIYSSTEHTPVFFCFLKDQLNIKCTLFHLGPHIIDFMTVGHNSWPRDGFRACLLKRKKRTD